MNHNQTLGQKGENIATEFLLDTGDYKILERNWRYAHWEIDIIALHKIFVVIVEVKTRRSDTFADPATAADIYKMRFLANAAEAYLNKYDMEAELRFDIITVVHNKLLTRITHIPDVYSGQ